MSWILITDEFLYLMSPGSDTWLKRQPRDGKAYSLPQSWQKEHDFSSVVVDLARATEPRFAASAPPVSAAPPVRGTPLAPPRVNPPLLYMKIRERGGPNGLIVFNLVALGGSTAKSWDVFSGAPGAQVIDRPERDWPGSNRPIPHGAYRLGAVERHPRGNWGPGLGPLWVDLLPHKPKNRRSAIGLHQDSNASSSPGSAGCVVHPQLTIVESICSWIAENKPVALLVDYGYGLEDEKAEMGIR